MMKKILVLMMIVSSVAMAQNRTNIWEMGSGPSTFNYGIDFNFGVADTFTDTNRWLRMVCTNASICDINGQILFYTNGKFCANRKNDTLYNSYNFNPGWETNTNPYALGIPQGVVILPFPDDPDKYIMFHESSTPIQTDSFNLYFPTNLSYSVVDMLLDNGYGGIDQIQKNLHLIDDTLVYGRIAACKHANGRDWWIIVQKYHSNLFYKWLLQADGLYGPYLQNIGITLPQTDHVLGFACFSPDGSKYATIGLYSTLQIFDFDRCTGEFSNARQTYTYIDTVPESTLGCSFSPNSRLIYVTDRFHVFQFDTWSNSLDSSKIFVADYDQSQYWSSYFFELQQAPDGYIYISPYGSANFLHYIEFPDNLGLACNVHSAGLITPFIDGYAPPYFPNYDLGTVQGSPCDTLSAHTIQLQTPTVHFNPNPASSYINIVYSVEHNATLTITNAYGIAVKQLTLYPYFKNRIVYVDDLAEGIYLVTLWEGDRVSSGKVIVER